MRRIAWKLGLPLMASWSLATACVSDLEPTDDGLGGLGGVAEAGGTGGTAAGGSGAVDSGTAGLGAMTGSEGGSEELPPEECLFAPVPPGVWGRYGYYWAAQ
jgi:hypothetical protein